MNNEHETKNSVFGFGDLNATYAKYFVGNSYLKALANSKNSNVNISNVTFEPGCRNNWHEHSIVQILIAVAGEGWYQEQGKVARKLLPGDVVIVEPHTKHWHGASNNSWFAHLAIMVGEGTTTWFDAVDDTQYSDLTE
ncbi:cupin domain-containing protein [Lactobacillus gigeriorum]|uniref:Cupin type-2 domain-containing protein n=1 Tax=Lactobacillus gigeriorum DSM 23908 = CRBIP 24.85 TaxID=1423751 RepID=I7K1R9_9LACO|nr:cupin domain-containing protein [Lactobacillus gigeriorum]KRN09803.1 hypothetical protein FC38_GL001271 [Lactobacillus gigeriorum DSM 23908 = CRBIP 24.85]CCI87610.1 Putative uncharacterized protein [Lactobacillus gigeriorum DSM 23908 = CRBIP 24.85]